MLESSALSTSSPAASSVMSRTWETSLRMKYLARSYIFFSRNERLFFSETMPALRVSGSVDAKTWTELASAPEEMAGEDVKDVALSLDGRYRYVKLAFAARQSGKRFELCEVDIWAPAAASAGAKQAPLVGEEQ